MHYGTMLPRRRGLLLAAALLLGARAAHGQCPDGAPPPCKGAVAAALRRANPTLNPRAWIVVPFANVTKTQELDWLRDGSANLLSMDMSRWTDVAVVPDKRVADLIRELPAVRSTAALTLNDGLSVARRAGAGRLVMGDFFRVGNGARFVANVFDVKSGDKVRTVVQQTGDADSLLTAFGPLARSVLAVPPPADAKTGDVGTQRLDAYQAYLLGVKALNRFDLPEARTQLTRALALDSTFALAHLQFANLLEWDDLSDGVQAKAHAAAAQRFGASLPRRERMLIEAGVASAASDYTRLCAVARSLVALDSTDIQGVFLLGECSFHDDAVIRSASDSTAGAFRGNWNTAIRSFERVIELDPTYLGAFEHIIDMLQRARRIVVDCGAAARRNDCPLWSSWVLRTGDTLEIVPVHPANRSAIATQGERWRRERPALANHTQADAIARRWVAADPSSEGARVGLARTSLMRGDLAAADAALKRVRPRAASDNLGTLRMKFEVVGKLGRGDEARAIFDSLVKTVADNPSIDVNRGALDLMLGRLARIERGIMAVGAPFGPEAVAYHRQIPRALLGLPRDGMARDEAAYFAAMRDSACDDGCRLGRVSPTLMYSLHVPSGAWPALIAGKYSGTGLDAARALAAGDTAQLRRAATVMEAEAHARIAMGAFEVLSVTATDAYLALGDSTSALRTARFFVDSSMVYMNISSGFIGGFGMTAAALWPRMMLKRADLAAAAGQREEARTWYTKVLDLWADADAELQPVVERIRRSRAALGQGR